MNIRPLKDYVSVRLIPPPKVSDGGIILLPHEDNKAVKSIVYGEVLAVGPGKNGSDMWGLKPGHIVAFSPVGMTEIKGSALIKRDSIVGMQ